MQRLTVGVQRHADLAQARLIIPGVFRHDLEC